MIELRGCRAAKYAEIHLTSSIVTYEQLRLKNKNRHVSVNVHLKHGIHMRELSPQKAPNESRRRHYDAQLP